jgi:tetratricopeptide (TPR) repeat protein
MHSDDRPYVEFECNRPVPPTALPGNVEVLVRAREPVWPRLANVPPEREQEVRAKLERWFRATEHLVRAQHASRVLESIGPFHRQYGEFYQTMRGEFQKVLQLNPDDENAQFLWRQKAVQHELAMAQLSARAGRPQEFLAHLQRAAAIAPDTLYGARARFMYQQARTSRAP